MRSKFGGRLELFVHNQALLVEGKELDQLSQVETIDAFYPLRESLDTLAAASYFVWLVDKATEEKQVNQPLFELLLGGLRQLTEDEDLAKVRRGFQHGFLAAEGILPQLGEDLTDSAFQEHFGDYASLKRNLGEFEHA